MAQAKALLATLNVLQLLDAADQWVMVEDSMGTASDSSDELMENGGAMTGPLATLDQIKKRYHLCIAHLKLVPHVEDLESTSRWRGSG